MVRLLGHTTSFNFNTDISDPRNDNRGENVWCDSDIFSD